MPWIQFNSKVMYSRTSSKDSFDEVVCSEPALVLDNSHEFDATYGMFYSYPERRDFFVMFFFFGRKFFSLALFYRLDNNYSFGVVSLISAILIQQTGIRKRIHRIGHLFIMHFSANSWTYEKNQTTSRDDNGILNGMFLFLSTVILFLLIRIDRTRNLPLCPVMQKNRKSVFRRLCLEQPGKLLLCFDRHYFRIQKALFKNMIQNMNKTVALFLIHIENGRMILLKRVILQVNQNEEQAVCNRGKWAIPVYDKTSSAIAVLTIHIVLGEILIMSCLEIGKQLAELFDGKTGQRTETFFVMLIIYIFHTAKIRTRTEYQ